MKIAIESGYDRFDLPKWLLEKCNDENFLKVRINIAKYLEENFDKEIDEEKLYSESLEKLLNENKILKVNTKFHSIYFIKKEDEKNNYPNNRYEFTIEDVDTTRPWHFSEYDGSEFIEYLDYEVVDKEFNYCKLKDE